MHPFLTDQLGAQHTRDLTATADRSRLAALARGCCASALSTVKALARNARRTLTRRPAAVECCLASA